VTGRKQRSDEERRLRSCNITAIGPRVDAASESLRRHVFALALLLDIGLMWRRAFERLLAQFVRRTECIETYHRIGQQMFAPLLF